MVKARARTARRAAARNAPPPRRHLAGIAKYRGDRTAAVVGEVKGPTTFGTLLVAVGAHYDPNTDRTRVTFATMTDRDCEHVARTRQAHVPFPIATTDYATGELVVQASKW